MNKSQSPDFTWNDIFEKNVLDGREFIYKRKDGSSVFGIAHNVALHYHGQQSMITLASLEAYGIRDRGKKDIVWSDGKKTIDFIMMNDRTKWNIFLTLEPIEQLKGIIKVLSDQKKHEGESILFTLKNDKWKTLSMY